MRIDRVVSYYARPSAYATGGVNDSRQEWAHYLGRAVGSSVILHPAAGYLEELVTGVEHKCVPHIGRQRMTMIPSGLSQYLRPHDLLMLHEGWTPSNLVAARVATQAGVPYVVTPHGVYEHQITQRQRFTVVRQPFERIVLERAAAVHIFFKSEAAHVRAIAPKATIVVAPTGFERSVPQWKGGGGYLGWFGRYDVWHKGLDLLLFAVASIPADRRPLVRLHGPDHLGGRREVEALITRLALSSHVRVGDPLVGEDLYEFIANSDGMLHTARWESYGRSVVECLAVGAPTLVTSVCHIADPGAAAGALVSVTADAAAIAQGLQALPASPGWTGQAARNYVRTQLAWDVSIAALLDGLSQTL